MALKHKGCECDNWVVYFFDIPIHVTLVVQLQLILSSYAETLMNQSSCQFIISVNVIMMICL